MAPINLNKTKIVEIFKTMDYPNVPIDTSMAEKWLYNRYQNISGQSVKIVFDEKKPPIYYPVLTQSDDAKKLYEKSQGNTLWKETAFSTKTKILYKFSKEIEANVEMISQLEVLIRNILPKDTKKTGLPQLVDYIKYYSTWVDDGFDNDHVVLCCTSMVYSLAEIGYFLGSLLAKGSNIIFYGKDSFAVVLDYLIELSIKAGIPKGTLKSICGSDNTLQTIIPLQIHKNIKIDDLEAFNNKTCLITPHIRSSMIIFNDSDMDSAIETCLTAIWGSCGLLPWSVDTLLVQEDIMQKFTDKLKMRLKKLQINEKSTTIDDISFYQTANWKDGLDKMVKNAKSQGIEVYQKDKKLTPTLFIGGKVNENNVLTKPMLKVPMANIIAFRTPKEAIACANNTQQGLAVSLWSQNISLINEVVRKLDVGTIWVNCYGIIKANVGFTTRKYEGIGYIGGAEGFYEFDELGKSEHIPETKPTQLITAKKSQESWCKIPFNSRVEILFKAIQNDLTSEWLDSFYNLKNLELTKSQIIDNYDLKTYRDPIGVIVVNKSENFPELILGSLLLGNSVVVIENERFSKQLSILIKNLPSGIFINAPASELGALECLKQHVVVIGSEKPVRRSIHCQKIYDFKNFDVGFMIRRCTITKNVWVDIGDSF